MLRVQTFEIGTRCLGVFLMAATVLHVGSSTASAQFVIGQEPGTDFIAWEAEDFNSITNGDDSTGFLVVDNVGEDDNTFVTDFGSTVLPETTNASRGVALYDQVGGSDQDFVTYQLQFAEAGTYHLYMHYSMFDRTDPTGYGNEDSVFVAREFGVSPVGPQGDNNFWASTPTMGATADDGTFEGNFHWWKVTKRDDEPEGADQYDPPVGEVLDFSVAAREAGTTIDKWVMSTNPDLTPEDLDALITFAPNTGDPGDFNDDGAVDLADFSIMAENFNMSFSVVDSFARGDQTRDGNVDLADFLAVRTIFSAPAGAASVPEPAGLSLAMSCVLLLGAMKRKRRS